MTNADISAGQEALHAYIAGIEGWFKTQFIPMAVYHEGAIDVIRAADAGNDQTPVGRQHSGQLALQTAVRQNAAAYASQITPQMYHDGTAVVLAAVNKMRARK